jgi:hypothetical protein
MMEDQELVKVFLPLPLYKWLIYKCQDIWIHEVDRYLKGQPPHRFLTTLIVRKKTFNSRNLKCLKTLKNKLILANLNLRSTQVINKKLITPISLRK